MDNVKKLAIYQAQVKNVRSLQIALRQINRLINASLRSNNTTQVEHLTKIYALMFCTWAEANFLKVVHTPHGLELDELEQVIASKRNNIVSGWKKAIELGIRHLDASRGNFRPNARKKLEELVDSHVFDPSVLRNKLAHGQWVIALNRNNDAVNSELTAMIGAIDIVRIMGWLEVHRLLAELVETLLESPKKAFIRDWYQYVVKLGDKMESAELRTLANHIAILRAKDARTGAVTKRRNPILSA
ncbi:hypothetical protein IFJ82_14460 [Novacetimonas hansenii]|uniref:hypothetical protein n=1 Tax=Novacetimonas hansenii TaxID=436 RepID=UPI00178553FB|nr:hypothetical protein [Novacetimonas hansenii]QOF95004.1 hypothetical protein IFJ82_14460 [Novacetimonas hansenii]